MSNNSDLNKIAPHPNNYFRADFAERRKGIIVFSRKNIVPALNTYPAFNGTGIKRRGRNWRCSSKYCRKEYSIFKNTLFSITKLKIYEKNGWASLDFEDCTIGGQDITVEIDESKLGNDKYHRGHLVSGD
ncbi:hypothetical protein RF11_16299 [Thelohanellus kitauei]|uniref:Uncharacterized protein n=1 Tax=Thelohanellus kitauei TaxID=669202 RepID=A0A0C2ITB0_THEKT|nr:hypothetical protein RF11_16299 [Thelohanellus kitauei]